MFTCSGRVYFGVSSWVVSLHHFPQAEEGEKQVSLERETEKKVLEEFGRCLAQIIEFASKSKKMT